MNRRSFLAGLAALPIVGKLFKREPNTCVCYDLRDGQTFTIEISSVSPDEPCEFFGRPFEIGRSGAQPLGIVERVNPNGTVSVRLA